MKSGTGTHAVTFFLKGTESFLFAAVGLLHVGSWVALYLLHLSQTIDSTITKDTMDSHVHGLLACSLIQEERCTKPFPINGRLL